MFRRTSNQGSLLESQWLVAPEKRKRLLASWAHPFREQILPRIDEEAFRPFFEENNGQPNKSISLLVGVHLLKERFDLTDSQVIENPQLIPAAPRCGASLRDSARPAARSTATRAVRAENLEFNILWQHALAVEPSDAHVCQKTLHNFRTLVVREKLGDALFVNTTRQIAKAAGISFARQRLDSTHVVSNMAILSRLGVLVETIAVFMGELRSELHDHLDALPAKYAQRYLDREGYFADAKKEQARRRLPVAAQDLFRLVRRFESDKEVSALPSFALMQRVLAEQCTIVERPGHAIGVVDDTDEQPEPCEPPAEPEAAPDTDAPADSASEPSPAQPPCEAPIDPAATERDVTAASEPSDEPTASAPASAANSDAVEPAVPASSADACTTDVVLRKPKEIQSTSLQSPHDPNATYGHKGKGYEVQLTETCGEQNPFELITSVAVNGAHESDQNALIPVLDHLVESAMPPERLFADTGYGSGENIVEAAERGIALVAPVQDPDKEKSDDSRWTQPVEPPLSSPHEPSEADPRTSETRPQQGAGEGRATKLGLHDCQFSPDFGALITCPAGRAPSEQSRVGGRAEVRFDANTCNGCPLAEMCPGRPMKGGGRRLSYKPAEAATAHRQREQRTPEFKDAYKIRSGIESTNSQLKGPQGADDLRVRGKERVKFVMTFKALGLNVFRFLRWAVDESAATVTAAAGHAADLAPVEA